MSEDLGFISKELRYRISNMKAELKQLEKKKDTLLGKTQQEYKKLQREIAKSGELILEFSKNKSLVREYHLYYDRLREMKKKLDAYRDYIECRISDLRKQDYSYKYEIKELLNEIDCDKKLLSKIKSLPEYTDFKVRREREKLIIKNGCITRQRSD